MGNLTEIGKCCRMMCAELWEPESDWMSFRKWQGGKGGISVGKRGGAYVTE